VQTLILLPVHDYSLTDCVCITDFIINTGTSAGEIRHEKLCVLYLLQYAMSDLPRVFNLISANRSDIDSCELLTNGCFYVFEFRMIRVHHHHDDAVQSQTLDVFRWSSKRQAVQNCSKKKRADVRLTIFASSWITASYGNPLSLYTTIFL
jgi:hypothetical protein